LFSLLKLYVPTLVVVFESAFQCVPILPHT
jgi:hypothetical protein